MDDAALESLIEDLTVQLVQSEGSSVWKHYLPGNLKLRLAKEVINYTSPKLNRLIPNTAPTYPITRLVDRVFRTYERMAQDQRDNGVLDNNFISMLRASRRMLMFVAENDIFYRRWLHVFLLTLYMEVKRTLPELAVIKTINVDK